MKMAVKGGETLRTLLFTTGSPFARGVRIILDELGLDYERREETATPPVEQRAGASATLQVPTFWDGDLVLWQSDLIAEYLLSTYTQRSVVIPPLADTVWRVESKWTDKLVLATVQTFGTAVTTISQMKWAGVSFNENDYLTRCADRLPHILNWLENHLISQNDGFFPSAVSIQDIFLVCYLRFIQNRPIGLNPDVSAHPKTEALVNRLDERESFKRNPVLWWEPEVRNNADGGYSLT